ncbi:MAG: NAD(P)/FAD-dependent oxidoreductase, partial [Bacteroidota bacterium]|nr:NAD(P)/FAD-dependent oxidoreductase [Bacteroidota bacterium]
MQPLPQYSVAIIGGGLAGLASAILLQQKGYSVALFEKEAYPFHKVCGEYISMESWNFLHSLGLPLCDWNLPQIDTLHLTAPNGAQFTTGLPLGGFGVSRYRLDHALENRAKEVGVHLFVNTRVEEVERGELFRIRFQNQTVTAKLCLGAWGKRGNLDVKWKRRFLQQGDTRLNNYIGIKYHVKTDWPQHVIGLHNFEDGYCGISKIEEDRYCLCYMTRATNLKRCNNSIQELEAQVLFRNRHLQKIFRNSEVVPGFPVTISQISFAQKGCVENGVLMLGDTAGMITPLCGNGMSIALHTAKMAATLGNAFLQEKISQQQLEAQYRAQWQKAFAVRLRMG